MFEMVWAMAGIVVTWVVVLAVFTGIGLGFRRLWGLRGITAEGVLESFWIGLVLAVLVLSLWHLAWPVRWPVQAVLAIGGLAGLLGSWRPLWAWLQSVVRRHRGALAAAGVLAVVLSNRALGPCTTHDSGLYHLNAVRWTTLFPIIPGLGNLHGPLAYNNAGLQIAALLEVGPWYGRSSHLVNPLYLLVLSFHIVLAASRLVRPESGSPVAKVYWLFLVTPVVLMLNRSWAASHSVEVLVAVVLLVAGGRMLAFLTEGSLPDRRGDFAVLVITVLLAFAVCVKLSSLAMAAVAGVVVTWAYIARCRRIGRGAGGLGWILGLPGAVLLVWLGRGVILSGYILYPFPLGALPVAWRMPDELVGQVRQAIIDEAFWRIHVDGVLDWVGHLGREVLMPTVIGLVSLAVVARRRSRLDAASRRAWLVVISVLPAIVIWAITAPQKRFAFFLFWILAGVTGAMALEAAGLLKARRHRIAVAVVLLAVGVVNVTPSKVFYGPGTDGGLHPALTEEMTTYVTNSGLVLYVPKTGRQCWDSPLPCTPCPRPDLRLRRAGELGSGFVIDPSLAASPTRPATRQPAAPPGDD